MRILAISDRERFAAHFTPLTCPALRRNTGLAIRLAFAWSDEHGAGLAPLVQWSSWDGPLPYLLSPENRHARLRAILTEDGPWDAVLICPDHLEPMRKVKRLVSEIDWPDRPPLVIGWQHGQQNLTPQTSDYCDVMAAWGRDGATILRLGGDTVPVRVLGTPAFNHLTPELAEDRGYLLAHCGHDDGQPSLLTQAWMDRVADAAEGREIVVKIHCNDRTPPPADWPLIDRVTFAPREVHPLDLIRCCHALYLDYASTAAIVAMRLGKRLILDGPAERLAEYADSGNLRGLVAETDPQIIARNLVKLVEELR